LSKALACAKKRRRDVDRSAAAGGKFASAFFFEFDEPTLTETSFSYSMHGAASLGQKGSAERPSFEVGSH
jgi:hypothetical protein